MLKLFLLLPLSVFCMSLPSLWLLAGIVLAVIIAFLCKFTLCEQLTDLKPAFYYSALMYALSLFSKLFENLAGVSLSAFAIAVLAPNPEFLQICLRLILIIQLSSLLFRSTSSMEIREGLISAEMFFRRAFSSFPIFRKHNSLQPRFSQNLSLFLGFIPEIFENWSAINMAWKARGGKNSFSKIKTVVFLLISFNMEKAAVKSRALAARQIRN
jgi:biotin transport system permease protein/energy-coupling factor transport system permease protein